MITKFLESQLGISSTTIAYLAGPLVLAAGGFGAITGGALVARWNLHYAGMIRLCMYSCCFSWFGNLAFVFNCPERTYTTPDGYVGAPKPTS
ncbi:solute carrier organic anion transporter family member 4A1-like [Rhipicephalus microplus]|uniref:solute carrier organic anion transporter family member 4A1-like n=1 Tax=Rhipicephalus microplus TaxID=6941 RepID=UPI003F6D7D47